MEQETVLSVIEALLFVSERPLSLEQIRTALPELSTSDIRAHLERMRADFEAQQKGVRIIEIAGGFQLVTAPQMSAFLKKFFKQKRTERLSRPALETLAIIAYKQPVTRLEIESLRNVNVDGIMLTLTEKGLVRVVGERKAPGRPKVYGTTKQFLEYFGLKSLEDLPKIEDFARLQAVEAEGIVPLSEEPQPDSGAPAEAAGQEPQNETALAEPSGQEVPHDPQG